MAYWERCRLLYEGGKSLLENDAVMRVLMPQHPAEPDGQYSTRRKMAYYENIAGSVLDYMAAGLSQDAVRVEVDTDGEGGKDATAAPAFYQDFARNTAPIPGRVCTLPELVKELVQGVFLYRRTWCAVDMPDSGGVEFPNLAAQEASGTLRAHAFSVRPQCVVDWEEDESATGELAWALQLSVIARRRTLFDSRNMVVWRYTLHTAKDRQVFEFEFDSTNQKAPDDSKPPTRIHPPKPHSFGRVPLLRFEPPQEARGLHAMAVIEPLARRHLEASNAKAYAEMRVLFCPRTVFLARRPLDPEDEQENEHAADPNRAEAQVYATSSIVMHDEKDRVEYPSPPTEVFKTAAENVQALKDAIHGATHQMALNVKQTSTVMGRSGESKEADRQSTSVVLAAIGEMVRTWLATELYPLLAAGRGDKPIKWVAKGLEDFQPGTADDLVAMAMNLATLPIESPTFQTAWKRRVAQVVLEDLGEEVSAEMLKTIEGELQGTEAHRQEAEEAVRDQTINPPEEDGPPAGGGA